MSADSRRRTTDLFTALAHPLRRRVLRALLQENTAMSPCELATRFGVPLNALGYHVRVLEECEAVKLAGTKPVRGATQHFYSCSVRTEWARTALAGSEDPPDKRHPPGGETG